tara:strand:+ start:137 stop:589 length:453 start_codon:yes stop_codon:yes gene_type:complete
MTFFRKPEDPIFCPPERPQGAAPPADLYQTMGSENIHKLLKDFYLELGASQIQGMFPKDLDGAAEKSALFFIGLLGGPPLYHQKYGHPRLRQRHLPFRIDSNARKVWLECFDKVLLNADQKYNLPTKDLKAFKEFLKRFSAWMVNTESDQ